MGTSTADLTIQILREIRDGVRATNERLDGLIGRVDGLNVRVDTLNERVDGLSGRVDQTNERLDLVEKTLADMAGQFVFISRYVQNSVKRQDARIESLETRVEKIERRGTAK